MTAKSEDFSFFHEAKNELVNLAVSVRPEWSADRLNLALLGAKQAGWPWIKAARAVFRLLLIRDSGPHDLIEEVRASAGYKPHPSGSELPEEYRSGKVALEQAVGGEHGAA